ncbi:MAG: FAD-binding oxidoreductase, partial [Nitrospirales bacterium]|nr:FAD-binding oxidoreductase [Nitrospirales bacterium]
MSQENRSSDRKDVDVAGLEKGLKATVDGEVRFDLASKALYVSDASNYRQVPIGVVLPRSVEAVESVMAVCSRYGAPVVSRGAGTGLCGQTCNVAVVIDFSKYLNRVLEIDPHAQQARVQPGTILDDLRGQAEKYHLTFGPDPSTHNRCTLGGMIGNNSCGVHSVMAGRTADNVLELDILTYEGLRMKVGPTSEEEADRIIAAGGRRADIYSRLRDLRNRYAGLIRKRFPRIPRRVSGYGLDELLPENGFNIARALVGTEGTCVTVLEATLRLVYSPPGRTLLVLGYPDVYSAGDHIPEIMEYGPTGCEGLDDLLIKFMQRKGLHTSYLKLLPEGGGWLVVEFGGKDKEESAERARRVMEKLGKTKNPPSMKIFSDPQDELEIWKVREAGLGATAHVPDEPLAWPGWEDAAVPPERVGSYLREFRALIEEFHLHASLYGHFGQGCIHCRISFDVFTHEGIRNFMKFIERSADLVVKYGGSFSAEHGDGQSKAIFLPKMYGPELMEAFREFKSIWDPGWKMNPGKVIDANRPDQDLRIGADYQPWEPATYFRFPRDTGSFSRSTLRCVGVGECRRTHDAFMCPSFQATREEMHTTRGRAHLLFEMLRGDLIKDGWKSREVHEALALCLGCKGCRHECPVEVDIATWKSEFLSHYYKHRLRPRAAYAMGLIGFWNGAASRLPGVVNFLNRAPGLRAAAKTLAGISPERSLPEYAPATFLSGFARSSGRNGQGEEVLLYPDYLNDCFYPESLAAAADILTRWGFRVVLPPKRPPALRPLLHYGMLSLAQREMLKAIELLYPFARRGVPLLFLEPSEVSAFRDELPGLFPNNMDGQRIKGLSFLLSEFIAERKLGLPRLEGKAVFHGHCHQKAVLNIHAAR